MRTSASLSVFCSNYWFLNQKARKGSGPLNSLLPILLYLPWPFKCQTDLSQGYWSFRIHWMCIAEHRGRESLKKNPFTQEVRHSWILTNATLIRSASGGGGCVAQSADGWLDMLLELLLWLGWLEATGEEFSKLHFDFNSEGFRIVMTCQIQCCSD